MPSSKSFNYAILDKHFANQAIFQTLTLKCSFRFIVKMAKQQRVKKQIVYTSLALFYLT